ncbi:5-aminolevulic acid synthase [Psychromarinibacter sp. S121]|uniref:5-aminolevulic acid synthase n=1 Tax=Psychromarinibacter sp. S121 TaxID=3415127 RepID=UPI003C798B48
MRSTALAILAAAALPAAAAAQPIGGDAAEEMLFSADAARVAINPRAGLSPEEDQTLRLLVESNGFTYYGAIAFAPGDGIMSESLQGAFNYHDVETASRTALLACEAMRSPDAGACILALQLFPSGYAPRAFQLSQDATRAFAKMRAAGEETAFAISATTGAFGVGTGQAADLKALSACQDTVGADDCAVVVSD